MSSAKPPSSGLPGARGPRRPGRTIDLKATEIAGDPAAGSEGAASTSAGESTEPPASAGEPAQPAGSAEASAEQPVPEAEIEARSETTGVGTEKSSETSTASTGGIFPTAWRQIAAGAAGAVLVLLVFLLFGMFSSRDPGVSGLDGRLARVEQQLGDMAGRPRPATIDPKAIDDLAARLARLEATAASPRPPAVDAALANRISTLEGGLKALGERLDVVARRGDEIATLAGEARSRANATATALADLQKAARLGPAVEHNEVDALANRVAALEQATKAIDAKLAQRAGAEATDRAVRLAVTAALLQAAVERGDPFAAELASAKSLAADAKTLTPLDPFAATGVPSAAALARELSGLTPALRQAIGTAPRDGNFLDRLQANAEKIVRIRPVDDTPGDDPAAIVARVELRATQSDPAGALAELAKLPPAARAPAQDWIAKAEARNAAIALSRRFARDALAALGQPSSERTQPQ